MTSNRVGRLGDGVVDGLFHALADAAAGLPISHLAVFEPPFVVGDGRPPLPSDYVQRLEEFVAAGRRDAAVELFLTAWASITIPVLVMYSHSTTPFLITAAQAAAELLPTATLQGVEGGFHSTSADILARALRRFARSAGHQPRTG